MFWKYFTRAMEVCEMEVSTLDPCLFVGDKVICICYVFGIIFWANNEACINELTSNLHTQGLLLEEEDDAAGFLGV